MKKRWNQLVFILFLPLLGWGQAFPFDCLLVNPNGDVDLYWTQVSAGAVEKYRIYYSFDGNTFSLLDSIGDPFVTNYHHSGAQANTGRRRYYLEAVISGQSNLFSDTLSTLYLQLDNSNPGWAKLYWNAVHTPLPEGSSSWYKIYREYPQGVWNMVDSTQNTQFFHWAHVCEDSLSFLIYIENAHCHSASNVVGGIFKDIEYPDKPLLDSVSVDVNSHVTMGWTASDSADVAGYIIYRFEGSVWIEIDTVFGKENAFFTDTTVDACAVNQEYAIASIDSCGNKSPGTFLTPQRPIFIYPIGFSTCSLEDTITWEAYINASPPVEKYEIYAAANGGSFFKVGEVPPTQFSYIHQGLQYGTDYAYFVRAVFGNNTSSSCVKNLVTVDYQRPRFVYLANADVLPDNTVQVAIHVDTAVQNSSWELWRSDDGGSSYSIIKSLTFNDLTSFPMQIVDETADASLQSYSYQIKTLDSCGKVALQSNIDKTIWLTGTLVSQQKVSLTWTAFEKWDAGVLRYRIYRMQGETIPSAPFDSVDASVFSYNDDISSVNIADGRFTYWLQAVEDTGDSYGYRETANSNRILLQQESHIYFPNAFRPDGLNKTFKPIFSFFGGTAYVFQIYNRWGQLIFETEDPLSGWQGTYQGRPVERGVYVYRLSYKNVFGGTVEKRGTVTVIY